VISDDNAAALRELEQAVKVGSTIAQKQVRRILHAVHALRREGDAAKALAENNSTVAKNAIADWKAIRDAEIAYEHRYCGGSIPCPGMKGHGNTVDERAAEHAEGGSS
jgi:transposase-like protein